MYWDKGHKTALKIAGFRTKEQRKGELLVFLRCRFCKVLGINDTPTTCIENKSKSSLKLSSHSFPVERYIIYISGTCEKKAMNWSVELFYFTLRKEYCIASFGSRESHPNSSYVETDPDCFLVSSIYKYDCAEELDFSLYEIPRFSLDILPDMKFTTSHGAKALF